MSLSFADLRIANATRHRRWYAEGGREWDRDDWLVAIGGEVGEALNIVKKLTRDSDLMKGDQPDRATLTTRLGEELADAVIYIDVATTEIGAVLFSTGEVRTFADLRAEHTPLAASRMRLAAFGRDALGVLGKLSTAREPWELRGHAEMLVTDLDLMADRAGIDLGGDVVSKFNATSVKYGFPERLTP